MQVKAEKDDFAFPVEDVVRKNAKDKRDKLLRIGLAYDLAHAKGHFNETDEEKKAKKLKEDEKKNKEKKELKEKLLKEKRRRKHVANKETVKEKQARLKRAAKAKAKAARLAVKVKEAQAKADAAKAAEPKVEVKTDSKDESKPAEVAVSTDDKPVAPVEGAVIAPVAEIIVPVIPLLEIPGEPPLVLPTDDEDSFDDDSDVDSVVSDISDGIIEEELAVLKQAEKDKPEEPAPDADDEEEEFQKKPWNAIAVVGLRVYCKGSDVSVKVVRPIVEDEDTKEKGETKLDVDDSARDATKAEDKAEKKEEVVEKKDGSEKSEGSGIVV